MSPPPIRVAVVGLGAIGSMALWRLSLRGIEVVGYDGSIPGHDTAAYGGYTRMMRPGHQRGVDNRLLNESVGLWKQLEVDTGEGLLAETGSLTAGPASDSHVADLLENVRAAGIEHEIVGARAANARFPQHSFNDDDTIAWSPHGFVIASNNAVAAAVQAARGRGAQIRSHERVFNLHRRGTTIVVETGKRSEAFDHVILACGSWIGSLAPVLAEAVVPRAVLSTWFRPRPGFSISPHDFPIGVRRLVDHQGFSFFPGLDDGLAKINVWEPIRPRICSHALGPPRVAASLVERAERLVDGAMPGLDPCSVAARAYPEGFTSDRRAVVGLLQPGVSVLAGFSGSGFGMGPLFGDIAADLAIRGQTPRPIGHLRVDRPAIVRRQPPASDVWSAQS